MFIQFQLVMIVSMPSLRNSERGRRLIKKASLTAALTCDRAQAGLCGRGLRVVRMG